MCLAFLQALRAEIDKLQEEIRQLQEGQAA
jgi:cell division protein FtsB